MHRKVERQLTFAPPAQEQAQHLNIDSDTLEFNTGKTQRLSMSPNSYL